MEPKAVQLERYMAAALLRAEIEPLFLEIRLM
jgi:hypothetical protein